MSPPVDTVRGDGKLHAAADVVVIGGGIIGCSAAYFLAKKGSYLNPHSPDSALFCGVGEPILI